MHRYFGDQWSYTLLNTISFIAATFGFLFFIKTKLKMPSIYVKIFGDIAAKSSVNSVRTHGKILFVAITAVELYLTARQIASTTIVNGDFGTLVGTGANYFGGLFLVPIVILILSCVTVIDPLKNSDLLAMVLPIQMFFVRLACFCNGCCWGVEWEYGLYNSHPNHPGKQVPVQGFEILCVLAIFIFFLIYRRKVKQPGKLLPLYMIIYSSTRFVIEFFTAAPTKILGPLNTYHFLCIIGVVYGIIMLIVIKFFGNKISALFEKLHQLIDVKIKNYQEEKEAKTLKENAKFEAKEKERLNSIKLARKKAKARRRK